MLTVASGLLVFMRPAIYDAARRIYNGAKRGGGDGDGAMLQAVMTAEILSHHRQTTERLA